MDHIQSGKTLPCVLGGVVAGFGIALIYSHVFGAKSATSKGDSAGSGIWNKEFTHPEGTPEGFTLRAISGGGATKEQSTPGVDCYLEKWEAGTAEPPHSHPGDDSTTVVEGEMVIQFFTKDGSCYHKEGSPVVLKAGQTGYIKGGRIHDAKYTKACRLIYVHDTKFEFIPAE